MHLLRHQYLAPMLIIDGDINKLTKHIWDTSTTIPSFAKRSFFLQDTEICDLDPGGLLFLKISRVEFIIDGIKFCMQISKAGEILGIFNDAEKRCPNYTCFWTFNYLVILPTVIFNKLKAKIKDFEMNSIALHAELHEYEVRGEIEKHFLEELDS